MWTAFAAVLFAKLDLLLLGEPIKYLDIESRKALGYALKKYQGRSDILVSHYVQFVEMIADRLWLLENCRASIFTRDITDYQKWLLVNVIAVSMASAKKLAKKIPDKQLSIGRQRRQNTRALQ